jgi:hypothetical protein
MKELLQSSAKLKGAANISYNLASKLTDLIELRRAVQRAEEAAAHRKATGTKQIVDRHRPRKARSRPVNARPILSAV